MVKGRIVTTFMDVQIIEEPDPKAKKWLVPTFARFVGQPRSSWSGRAFRINSADEQHGEWEPIIAEQASAVNWAKPDLAKAFIVEVCLGRQRIPMAMALVGPMPPGLYHRTFYQDRRAYVLAAMVDGSWSRVKDFGDEHSHCPDKLYRPDFQDLVEEAVRDDDARQLFGLKGGETWEVFLEWLGLDESHYYDIHYYPGCEIHC